MEFSRTTFEALRSRGMTRAWNGIGGSHTLVTYPPLDALRPLSPEVVLPNLSGIRSISLYVHVPFCEMSCAFCPYETHVMSGSESNADAYLQALRKEMDLIGINLRNAEVRTLYVGGGTATVLSETQLETLLNELRQHFTFSPDVLICVETSPNALIQSPAKMALLQHLGVKRVSVGVQTFSEAALRTEGRTHSRAETLSVLEALIRKIDVVNVDLMQDMPDQTDDDLANDIQHIANLRPAQVTWYVERLRKWQGEFPDAYRSIVRRLQLRDSMKSLAYRPRPGGRFVLSGRADDAFKSVRCGLGSHLVGLGASAYSHVPGYFYRNVVDTTAYINMVHNGILPIATGARLRHVDILAGRLAAGIRWGVRFAEADSDLSGYVTESKRRLEILMRHDLVHYNSTTEEYQITLDGPGWAYEEEICSLFVTQDHIDQIRSKNLAWWFPSSSKLKTQTIDALSFLA